MSSAQNPQTQFFDRVANTKLTLLKDIVEENETNNPKELQMQLLTLIKQERDSANVASIIAEINKSRISPKPEDIPKIMKRLHDEHIELSQKYMKALQVVQEIFKEELK